MAKSARFPQEMDLSCLFEAETPPFSTVISLDRAAGIRGELPLKTTERTVKSAYGSDAITAIRDAQSQCTGSSYQSGNALWYYVSKVYFSCDGDGVEGDWEGDLSQVLHCELLADMGTRYFRDLEQTYLHSREEVVRRIKAITALYPESPLYPPPTVYETDEMTVISKVKTEETSRRSQVFLRYTSQAEASRLVDSSACQVCGSRDHDSPLNALTACQCCGRKVHFCCYGVQKGASVWVCDMCKLYGPGATQVCGLCGLAGGVMKATIQPQNYPQSSADKRKAWTHLYCANALSAAFVIPETKEMIDLSHIDRSAWGWKCCFCGGKSGACLKCWEKDCWERFHVECWRRAVRPAAPWPREGIGCKAHCGKVTREWVRLWEAGVVREVQTFSANLFCASRSKSSLRRRAGSQRLSTSESRSLQRTLAALLSIANSKQEFRIILDRNQRGKQVETPRNYTIISPAVLRELGVSLPGKTAEQCYCHYEKVYESLREKAQKPVIELQKLTERQLQAMTRCLRQDF